MRVALPHSLGREELRRRMKEHGHEIGDQFPAGMATVETDWPHEDRMNLHITAMGQQIEGGIDVGDDEVVIELDLPGILGMMRGTIEGAVRKYGTKMLEKS